MSTTVSSKEGRLWSDIRSSNDERFNNINLNSNDRKSYNNDKSEKTLSTWPNHQNKSAGGNVNEYYDPWEKKNKEYYDPWERSDKRDMLNGSYFAGVEKDNGINGRGNNFNDVNSGSTLSLHITNYGNSIKLESNGSFSEDKSKTNKMIHGNSCKNFVINSTKNTDCFEIPRQQNDTPSVPEIMKFKASQKLLHPNSLNPRPIQLEDYHWHIRLKIYEYIAANARRIFGIKSANLGEQAYSRLVQLSQIAPQPVGQNLYAGNDDLWALAEMLECNIYTYVPDAHPAYPALNPYFKNNKKIKGAPTLFLLYINSNHFEPIVQFM
uniref:OTU domain-containing protein n=1 Tax=Panagrolaimus davidi TaxID=227884 RepID=A0A914QKW9_9BILA